MADDDHLRHLQKGIKHWNAWVATQGADFVAHFHDADLSFQHLENANLKYAILTGANLAGSNLKKADLREARLNNANLKQADLSEALLSAVDARWASFTGCVLDDANVTSELYFRPRTSEVVATVFTDTSQWQNLTQGQLDTMAGDAGTIISAQFKRPKSWKPLDGFENGESLSQEPLTDEDEYTKIANSWNESLSKNVSGILKRLKTSGRSEAGPTPEATALQYQAPTAAPLPRVDPDTSRFVFLSYKREDRPWVQRFRESLRENGIAVWWDDDIPYDANWDDEIDTHLEEAEIILTVWTDKSIESREVRNEALYAMRNDKLVQVQRGNPKLSPRYSSIQCADLTDWAPDAGHADFDRLLATLRRRLGT